MRHCISASLRRLSPTIWQGIANGWVTDRDSALRRIDEACAQLQQLDADGVPAYTARVIQSFLKEDWPAVLGLTEAFAERHRHPNAFGARGMALLVTGQPDAAVAALETALRLSPRDPIRAEWQYRLAMAHFIAGRDELACDWGHSAAVTHPGLPWPPIHAAAMELLGQKAEARPAFEDHMARHPNFEAGHIAQRVPGANPLVVEGRERLATSLRRIGMRS